MGVYVDELRETPAIAKKRWPHMYYAHLTADSVEELQTFARVIDLKPEWFQKKSVPHYDVTKIKRRRALDMGAKFMTAKEQAKKRLAIKKQIKGGDLL